MHAYLYNLTCTHTIIYKLVMIVASTFLWSKNAVVIENLAVLMGGNREGWPRIGLDEKIIQMQIP